MDILKIIGVAFICIFLSLIIKQYRPEFAIYITIIGGIIIFYYAVNKLNIIIELLKSLSSKIDLDVSFLSTLLKITGIAYITEFASNSCKDAGESAIASKVEFAR